MEILQTGPKVAELVQDVAIRLGCVQIAFFIVFLTSLLVRVHNNQCHIIDADFCSDT